MLPIGDWWRMNGTWTRQQHVWWRVKGNVTRLENHFWAALKENEHVWRGMNTFEGEWTRQTPSYAILMASHGEPSSFEGDMNSTWTRLKEKQARVNENGGESQRVQSECSSLEGRTEHAWAESSSTPVRLHLVCSCVMISRHTSNTWLTELVGIKAGVSSSSAQSPWNFEPSLQLSILPRQFKKL